MLRFLCYIELKERFSFSLGFLCCCWFLLLFFFVVIFFLFTQEIFKKIEAAQNILAK